MQTINESNEKLGFTLLHHQVARLHIKVRELHEMQREGLVTPGLLEDYPFQCLHCVNPRGGEGAQQRQAGQRAGNDRIDVPRCD